MPPERDFNILVVDDTESMRHSITACLSKEFKVFEASSGIEAINILEEEKIDLVFTDAIMPGMNGIEIIKLLRSHYPHIRYVLMTGFDVNAFIAIARQEQIWNILPKTAFMNINFIRSIARKLLTGEIFGADKYYPDLISAHTSLCKLHKLKKTEPLEKNHFYICNVASEEENSVVSDTVGDILLQNGVPSSYRHVIEELTSNARLRAPAEREKKYYHSSRVCLATPGYYELGFGLIDQLVFLSVTDYCGSMDREEILYRLERQVTVDPATGLPVGLTDSHGRGLFISREQSDHLVFNIEPGLRTEVISIYNLQSPQQTKAFSIYQVENRIE